MLVHNDPYARKLEQLKSPNRGGIRLCRIIEDERIEEFDAWIEERVNNNKLFPDS